jgi:predicted nuclease of predicted toxin-antitoxin system
MYYYMDENVDGRVTEGLRRRGVDVLTAQEDGYSGRDDPEVLDRATALGRLLYAQDEDMITEGKRRQAAGIPYPGVIYCHQLKLSVGRRVIDLEIIAKYGDPAEYENRVTHLPIR